MVTTSAGRSFVADISNLSARSVFIHTAQPLEFQDEVVLALFDHTARAEVALVSFDPRGVLLTFQPDELLEDAIYQAQPHAHVVASPAVDADVWREITNSEAYSDHPEDLDFDIEPETDIGLTPVARPDGDDRFGAETPIPSPVSGTEGSEGPAAGPERSSFDVARAQLGLQQPAGRLEEEDEEPIDPKDPVPTLGRNGYSVRFGSKDAYRAQHESHIEHGGLVVRSEPMKVGAQKTLVLQVPGVERYTVSGRVVFNQPGLVGFMLDSFSLHRDRLRAMTL
ncbi:MAG: hypothetical protein ACFB9M_02040 [Myxococcota bacterium]